MLFGHTLIYHHKPLNMKKKPLLEEEIINNNCPCSYDSCGISKTAQCPHCGRVAMRGNVCICPRTGFVHLERLNSTHIKEHNLMSKEDQEKNTIKLWIGPGL